MIRLGWLGTLIIGVVLVVIGYNLAQPTPLNSVEIIVGWIFVVIGVLMVIFGTFTYFGHRGPPTEPGPGGRRYYRWW